MFQEEFVELERRVARYESGEDGFSNLVSCSDASGNVIKFELTPCGFLEVFKNGDQISGLTDFESSNFPAAGSITLNVWKTHGCLGAMKIDKDMTTDDSRASEEVSAAHRVAAEPRRSDEEIERERIRIQFRRDGQFRKQALRQWKCRASCD